MKNITFFLIFSFCVFSLWGCPKEIEDYVLSTIEWNGDIPQGVYRFPGTVEDTAGTYVWDNGSGISTLYIAKGITNIKSNPNALYVVVAPEAINPDTVWHLQCQEQILSDLKVAGVSNPEEKLKEIVDVGNKQASAIDEENVAFLQAPWEAKGLISSIAVNQKNKKPFTWGMIKNGVGK